MVRIYHINYIFTNLDIKEFHPSLARDLLLVAIIYKKSIIKISDGETNILHFKYTDIWIKKRMIIRTWSLGWFQWSQNLQINQYRYSL